MVGDCSESGCSWLGYNGVEYGRVEGIDGEDLRSAACGTVSEIYGVYLRCGGGMARGGILG